MIKTIVRINGRKVGRTTIRSFASNVSASLDLQKVRDEIVDEWLRREAATPGATLTKARYCCFTRDDGRRAYAETSAAWHWLDRELSSNLAGETGAVAIYEGAAAAMRIRFADRADAIGFVESHGANERRHLALFRSILPPAGKHTRLIPLWRAAGRTLGFLPTLLGGPRALYVTVESVETFVEEHFRDQIAPLTEDGSCPELVRLLESCCEDEVEHKEDAARRLLDGEGDVRAWWVRPWSEIVRRGSSVAAEIARRV